MGSAAVSILVPPTSSPGPRIRVRATSSSPNKQNRRTDESPLDNVTYVAKLPDTNE